MDDSMLHGFFGAEPISPVHYDVVLTTSTGDPAPTDIAVRSLELIEGLSRPFELTCVLRTRDVELELDAFIAGRLLLTFGREGEDHRHIEGVVLRVDYERTFDDALYLRVVAKPPLALAAFTKRSRIFERMSTLDIIEAVLAPELAPYSGSVDPSRLSGKSTRRDFCVQYEETDLDFVQRLLAEDGLSYICTGPTVVLHDSNVSFSPVSGESPDERPQVPLIPTNAQEASVQSVQYLARGRALHTPHTIASAWDPYAPVLLRNDAGDTQADRLAHAHDTRRLFHPDDPRARAHRRLEQLRGDALYISGTGNHCGFAAGGTWELSHHPHLEFDGDYLLLEVLHLVDCPEVELGQSHGGSTYLNRFSALPLDVPFRSASPSKPRIPSMQTALVLGADDQPVTTEDGDDIHTDEHGRIRVRFHWDGAPSCWVRVLQSWAGPGFGSQFIPRVGMEVAVSFIDGDPERPLVTGCVYNGANRPPFDLPEHKTQSGWRTRSSPSGTGHNELRFEDARHREEVHLRAQRNLRTHVGADESHAVGKNQKVEIGEERFTEVGTHDALIVGSSRLVLVKGQPIDGSRKIGDTVVVAAGDRRIEVSDGDDLKRVLKGDHTTTVDEGSFRIRTGNKAPESIPPHKPSIALQAQESIVLEAHTSIELRCGASSLVLHPEQAQLKVGDSVIQLVPGRTDVVANDIATVAKSTVLIIGKSSSVGVSQDVAIHAGAGSLSALASRVNLVGTNETGVFSNKLALMGAPETRVGGGQTVAVEGGELQLSAEATATLNGALVKIN